MDVLISKLNRLALIMEGEQISGHLVASIRTSMEDKEPAWTTEALEKLKNEGTDLVRRTDLDEEAVSKLLYRYCLEEVSTLFVRATLRGDCPPAARRQGIMMLDQLLQQEPWFHAWLCEQAAMQEVPQGADISGALALAGKQGATLVIAFLKAIGRRHPPRGIKWPASIEHTPRPS